MREGNSFSLFTLAGGGGGCPIPGPDGGYPILGPDGGYPIPGLGGGCPFCWWGDPHPRSGLEGAHQQNGYLNPRLDGVPPPPSRPGMGVPLGIPPPVQDWMEYPLSKTGWGTPLVQDWIGYLPSKIRTGGTPCQQNGVPPHPRLDGVPPRPSRPGMGVPCRVPPVQDWMGYPPSKTGWGTPHPRLDGVPPSKVGWGTPPSKIGWGTPHPWLDGVSPPLAKRALAMRRAVCLLRSHRRTFLFLRTFRRRQTRILSDA